ncbi:MAG TPA: hypothetical protein V6D12_10890 [Candidatus Obscuribacterales bacterium]
MHENRHRLKLPELRSFALQQLNIPVATIRQHGELRLRETWLIVNASASMSKIEEPATGNADPATLSSVPMQFQPASKEGATPTLLHRNNWRDGERQLTSGQNDHKLRTRPKVVSGQNVHLPKLLPCNASSYLGVSA